uniref:Uncharacterized protein n=1 Tax=Cacopsylla melanoneura TaxID=428564 RepID=A0A8D8XC77_9HEMI
MLATSLASLTLFTGNSVEFSAHVFPVDRKTLLKTYVWSVALYGSEAWTMGCVDQRRLEAFEMWCYRRMMKIRWMDKVTNEEVLRKVNDSSSLWNTLNRGKMIMIGHNETREYATPSARRRNRKEM